MKIKRILVAFAALLSFSGVMAQQMPQVPVDPNVKVGKLDNGLTYYIRHNAYPENVASYYIVQRVGSVNEDESQRGLAHLLEHLAFNGTDHFKDNDLQEYLQSIGVEYGRNLNAATGADQTTYFFTDVPSKRLTAVDSCLLILKDWSNGITLTQKAIDDERDIVHNEYRMRMVGQMRILERALPRLYPGSKYGERMPIGLMSVIDGCSPEAIRSYYRKWYRPDNQAIVVVGDIDVDHIEAKIKELFGGIKVPADAAQVVPEAVPDNNTAIYIVDKDKELQTDICLLCMKSDPLPAEMKSTMAYYVQEYVSNLICSMLNQRYLEKANEPECPYLQAQSEQGEYIMSRTKDAFMVNAVAKPGMMKEAYAAVLTEIKRAHDFGFNASEYLRAKEELMSAVEKAYSNRDKMKNEEFTQQYVANFADGDPIPSMEQEYQIYQQLSTLPVDLINQASQSLLAQTDTNLVTLMMMQDKDGAVYPTEQELADIVAKVRATPLEAYVDNVKQEPLMAQAPKAGKIVKTTEDKKLGFKQLALSNGVKVILKKTDFKNDEIKFLGRANGGMMSMPQSDAAMAQIFGDLAGVCGLGDFSNTDLQKTLAGKQVNIGVALNENTRNISGTSTPKDIETLMQLIYLNMTNKSKDEKSMKNLINTYSTILKNQSSNPSLVFSDSVSSTLYPGNRMFRTPSSEDVEAIDLDKFISTVKNLYGNAKDFTFYFVGNYDEATLLPLIETYIASLPNSGNSVKSIAVNVAKGEKKNQFTKQMENPQDQAKEYWSSNNLPYTLRNAVSTDIAGRLLDMNFNRSIREKLSAAYHAGAGNDLTVNPDKTVVYAMVGEAQLNPEKSSEAVPYFYSGMKEVSTTPNAEDLQKVKEILLKQADVDAKTNGYWIGVLNAYVTYGLDFHTDYKSTISATTAKTITDYLQNVILKSGNHTEILMNATK